MNRIRGRIGRTSLLQRLVVLELGLVSVLLVCVSHFVARGVSQPGWRTFWELSAVLGLLIFAATATGMHRLVRSMDREIERTQAELAASALVAQAASRALDSGPFLDTATDWVEESLDLAGAIVAIRQPGSTATQYVLGNRAGTHLGLVQLERCELCLNRVLDRSTSPAARERFLARMSGRCTQEPDEATPDLGYVLRPLALPDGTEGMLCVLRWPERIDLPRLDSRIDRLERIAG